MDQGVYDRIEFNMECVIFESGWIDHEINLS